MKISKNINGMSDYLAFMDIDYYGAPHHNNHAGTETSN